MKIQTFARWLAVQPPQASIFFLPSNEFISFTLLDICTCQPHTRFRCASKKNIGVIALKCNLAVFSVQFSFSRFLTFNFFSLEAKHKKCVASRFFLFLQLQRGKSYIIILFLAFHLRCTTALALRRAGRKTSNLCIHSFHSLLEVFDVFFVSSDDADGC